MLFNSHEYIFFLLPIAFFGYYFLGKRVSANSAVAWLVLTSLFYYGWWNPSYLILIMLSIVANYMVGIKLGHMHENKHLVSKGLLTFGICANLALLFYYKYAHFIVTNLNELAGFKWHLNAIILPLAISFFTFQQIAYLVDAYEGKTKEYRFLHYCLFVLFFPQLIAGPIVHHSEMLPQFTEKKLKFNINTYNLSVGVTMFSIGLFKKVILADTIARYGNPVFHAADGGLTLSFIEAWAGALAYTMQLYFDFSGYTDMALGSARLFGITLPQNFNSPYKSENIIDFWRRWHMTLSRFLRDYLYIPLGGNRRGKFRRLMNLMITMLLGGLWHGAGWNFVFWGGLHGLYLVFNHFFRSIKGYLGLDVNRKTWWGRRISWAITFVAVIIAWVFFRAKTFDGAINLISAMTGVNGIILDERLAGVLGFLPDFVIFQGKGLGSFGSIYGLLWLSILIILVRFFPNTQELLKDYRPCLDLDEQFQTHQFIWLKWHATLPWAILTAMACGGGILGLSRINEFLYYQF